MRKLFTITLRKPTGQLIQFNVIALSALTGTESEPSAVDKAIAKVLTDESLTLTHDDVISMTTLGQIDIA